MKNAVFYQNNSAYIGRLVGHQSRIPENMKTLYNLPTVHHYAYVNINLSR